MTEVKETMETTEEIVARQNDFCVISKEANENGWRDLQTNSSWSTNPDPDYFVVVRDELVPGIKETFGYCNITLNEEGTEVIDFSPIEIPVLPEAEPAPTQLDIIEAQITYTAMMTNTLLEV